MELHYLHLTFKYHCAIFFLLVSFYFNREQNKAKCNKIKIIKTEKFSNQDLSVHDRRQESYRYMHAHTDSQKVNLHTINFRCFTFFRVLHHYKSHKVYLFSKKTENLAYKN